MAHYTLHAAMQSNKTHTLLTMLRGMDSENARKVARDIFGSDTFDNLIEDLRMALDASKQNDELEWNKPFQTKFGEMSHQMTYRVILTNGRTLRHVRILTHQAYKPMEEGTDRYSHARFEFQYVNSNRTSSKWSSEIAAILPE